MQVVQIDNIERLQDPHPDLSGTEVLNLLNGGPRGMVSIAEFAPGGFHKLHRHFRATQISYLIAGEGEHLTEHGPVPVKAGGATLVGPHEWHGFRNNSASQKAVLLSMYSPAATMPAAGYETFASPIRTGLAQVPSRDLSGWDGQTLSNDQCSLGTVTIQAGSSLELPPGDGFLYLVAGLGLVGSHALSSGQIVYLNSMAFTNNTQTPARVIFGHFG